jgi:hypothetical protein
MYAKSLHYRAAGIARVSIREYLWGGGGTASGVLEGAGAH